MAVLHHEPHGDGTGAEHRRSAVTRRATRSGDSDGGVHRDREHERKRAADGDAPASGHSHGTSALRRRMSTASASTTRIPPVMPTASHMGKPEPARAGGPPGIPMPTSLADGNTPSCVET